MKTGKIPGSDGIPIEFYQKYYELLKTLMLQMCKSAAKHGLHTTARQGVITLIEKSGKNLELLSNWRPLSLLNCDGKVYTKILANRLEIVTDYLIHTDQSGFQKGRSITDNLMDLLSIIDFAQYNKERMVVVGFDFAKAFDKIDWSYIDKTLELFGFGETFREMVTSAHRNTTCCTLNGGHASSYMNLERGLRQGSPLSTGLFILAVEILGLAIRQNRNITGIKINGKEKKHGQYADDLWAAIQADDGSYQELLDVFDNFAQISGLYVHYDKSHVLRIGSLQGTNFKINSDKPLKWVDSARILGIQFSADRTLMTKNNYDELIKKMGTVLNTWSARSGTLIGKIAVINALVMSQVVYKTLVLNTPDKKTIDRIRKNVLHFLWGNEKPKIAYNTLIRSYENGGLNLHDFSAKNKALKLTWVKKVLSTDNVWKYVANVILPYPIPELLECNLDKKDFEKIGINKEYAIYSIIHTWCEVNFERLDIIDDIENQVLWFNSHVRSQNKPYINDRMNNKGIVKMSNIYSIYEKDFSPIKS